MLIYLYCLYYKINKKALTLYLLYHHPISAPAKAIRLLLGECEMEYQALLEEPWQPSPEFLQRNSTNILPVLVASDLTIIGAMPIAEHIYETMKNKTNIYPRSSAARAEMRRLCEFALFRFEYEVCAPLTYERITKRMLPSDAGGGAPDSNILRAARGLLENYLHYFSSLIEQREYLACEDLSFADLTTAACLCVLDYLGEIEWQEGSVLKNWYARLKSRPSFRPLLSDRIKGVACVSHYVDLDF